MHLQSAILEDDESGEPLHIQLRKRIKAYREVRKEAGHMWPLPARTAGWLAWLEPT